MTHMEGVKPNDPKTREFWDNKARTFPRFEEGEDNYEAGVLDRIRRHGVDFHGKTVLDVGSGSGMYTIRIAREAERVTAVDISQGMLDILREDAGAQGLSNIDCVRSEWMEFDSDATFDIVFCSMTPAIRDDASRLKLLRHAGGVTVFMGFAGLMDSNIMTPLYARYGVTPKVFTNGTDMRLWLEEHDVPYRMHPIEGTWVVPKTLEARVDGASLFLKQYGVDPDPADLKRFMARYEEKPGVFVERTDYKIELLIWDRPDGE